MIRQVWRAMRPRRSDTDDRVKRRPLPVLPTVLGGVVAAVAAGLGMLALRSALSVRTIPERVMEWLLLYVPPDQFEAALLRFGFEAKRYGLYAAITGMLLLLAVPGAIALRRRWSGRAILALGLALWLFTMVVIMPLTDAGFFATELLDGTPAAVGGYLAVALAYAATLAGMRRAIPASNGRPRRAAPSRRAALLLTGSSLAAFGATFLTARWGPRPGAPASLIVLDPQEPVPSGGIDPPKPHPNLVGTVLPAPVAEPWRPSGAGSGARADSNPGRAPETGPAPAAAPAAAGPELAPTGVPEPPLSRQLARDQDGAVLPLSRPPGELAELITGNDSFYIVTKNAGGDPVLRAADWRLRVDGDVERPVELDVAVLRTLPAVELTKTLECISNFVDNCELAPFGCDLISTARWRGVPLGNVLELAGGLRPGVVSLSTISADEFTATLPIEVALDPDTLLVYEMNGQVLPREHGYPARVLVPGRYGMKSAKWVVALRPLRRESVDWYGQRQWSKEGIVKTMTRIDSPARGAILPPGPHRVAGIAYAGDRGISKVEFSADDGAAWRVAELLDTMPGRDAWVRWEGRFTLEPGAELTLVSRATDRTGELQIEAFSLPQPNGSTGWHHATVKSM